MTMPVPWSCRSSQQDGSRCPCAAAQTVRPSGRESAAGVHRASAPRGNTSWRAGRYITRRPPSRCALRDHCGGMPLWFLLTAFFRLQTKNCQPRIAPEAGSARGSTLISCSGLDAANGVSPALTGARFARSPPRPLSANDGRSLRQTARLLFPVTTPILLVLYYHQGSAVSRFFRKLHRPRTFVRVYS